MTKPTYDELSRVYDGPIPEEFLNRRDPERDLKRAIDCGQDAAKQFLAEGSTALKTGQLDKVIPLLNRALDNIRYVQIRIEALAKLRTDKAAAAVPDTAAMCEEAGDDDASPSYRS